MHSFWEDKYWLSDFDFVVIGSGIVGVSSAIEIKKKFPQKTVSIIERRDMPTGASTKNAGFSCFGTAGEILDDLLHEEESNVIETIKLRWEGLQLLMSNVPSVEMAYYNFGGSEVFTDKDGFEFCADKLTHVNQIIEAAIGIKSVINIGTQSFTNGLYKSVLFNALEGQLNPVLMMKSLIQQALALGIVIQNNIEVVKYTDLGKNVLLDLTSGLSFKAHKVIICTNAFTSQLDQNLDVIPARNQVFVTKPIANLALKGTYHYDRGYVYFRNIGDRILIGGARNIDSETETTGEFGKNSRILDYLVGFVQSNLCIEPIEIEKKWSGIIATGNSKKPIVERRSENVYMAVRLGGMGVAVGSKVAKEVSELIEL